VNITCDPNKRAATLKNRGLDFMDAAKVFAGVTITAEDTRKNYGEDRFQTVGHLEGRMVMLVWTPRNDDVHVISMRKCNAREKKSYGKRFAQG
jgi:uncharacterized DUF497 family protein